MNDYNVIIAARTDSSRLPGKVLKSLKEIPLIVYLIRRLKTSKKISKLVLATTDLPSDDELVNIVKNEDIPVFRGTRDDVVKRFVDVAAFYDMDYVVRVTGDCPFVDGVSLDYCLKACDQLDFFDLATTKGNFPIGIDYEIYQANFMAKFHQKNLTPDEREHLTLPIYNRAKDYHIERLVPPDTWPKTTKTFTVDTEEDYQFAKNLSESYDDLHIGVDVLLKDSHMSL